MTDGLLQFGETPKRLSRRGLLIGGGVGIGLLVAWSVWPRRYPANIAAAKGEHVINSYLKIGEDGHVTAIIPQVELGQGSYTVLAQLIADELGADWRQIAVEPAPFNPVYANTLLSREWANPVSTWMFGDVARDFAEERGTRGDFQITGGSSSVRALGMDMRRAAAAARAVLCMAAAERWDADWRACETADGFCIRGADRVRFGEVAAEAAGYDAPKSVVLRQGYENRLVGKSLPRLDVPAKLDGTLNYAADIRLPDMVFAAIRMGPLGDTRFVSADEAAARRQPGFIRLVKTERWVAAIAQNWWAAERALDAAQPRFTADGGFPEGKDARAATLQALDDEGWSMAETGDVNAAFATGRLLRADYFVGLAPHAPIEPMAATAAIRDDVLELWVSTQAPSLARKAAAREIGYAEANVILHPVQLGGSFGRKYEVEIAAQAARLAQELGRPVQLVWSRREDLRQDRFRPMAAARLIAKLAPGGRIDAMRTRIAAPASLAEMQARIIDGAHPSEARTRAAARDPAIISGAYPPYAMPNFSLRMHPAAPGIPTGKWRSGADSYAAFFTESFIDELARQSGIEPFSFRMAMLGNQPRLAACLSKAAILANWEGGTPGTQQGIACHAMLGSQIAVVAEAHVTEDQRVRVRKIVAVADVGRVVNPDIVRQQIEGGLIFGMAAAIGNRIAIERGRAEPSRLGGLRLPRIADSPEIVIELILSNATPGGIGEIAVPPVAPAIANALHAGSGRRFRSLPLLPANAI